MVGQAIRLLGFYLFLSNVPLFHCLGAFGNSLLEDLIVILPFLEIVSMLIFPEEEVVGYFFPFLIFDRIFIPIFGISFLLVKLFFQIKVRPALTLNYNSALFLMRESQNIFFSKHVSLILLKPT